MQGVELSGASSTLAALRHEEDALTAQLETLRARMKRCVALARELPDLERRANERSQGAYRTEARDLAQRLDEARRARDERAMLRIDEANAMTELEVVRAKLERRGIRKVALPILEHARVASPCSVSWADMEGDSDTRFCSLCEKHVLNLSMMSRAEAEAALDVALQTGGACVRLYRRADGTLITSDCPVGERHRFWRRTRGIAMAGLLLAALGALAYSRLLEDIQPPCSAVMGGL